MSILEVHGLTQGYGDKILYKNVDFTLEKGEHVGVVGQNGVGKSTLIRLLSGEAVADAGQIRWREGLRVGHLDQHAALAGGGSIEAYLKTAYADLYAARDEMDRLFAEAAGAGGEAALLRAGELQEQLLAQGFYELDSRVRKVAFGLGLDAIGLETMVEALSGGQRAKVILAKLLLAAPEVMLLDEPTNFLDAAHVDWLCGWLVGAAGAFVVVSHDAAFLERVAGGILDIEFGTITRYHCGYREFLRQKKHHREDYIRRYTAQQQHIQRTEAYIRRNIAGVNTKNARGRRTRLEKMDKLARPEFAEVPAFRFAPAVLTAATALRVRQLEVGYYYPLLPPLDFEIAGGQKLVVTGFNGIGKSTLLKTLVGELPALAGSHRFAEGVRIGYFSQDLAWPCPQQTPLQVVGQAWPALPEKQLRRALARCAVKAEHTRQPVGTLSGGEQAKVKLCLLILEEANLLVMDEPTNHLDAETKEVLRAQLAAFGGSVLLVTHEQRFYRDFADRVLDIGALVK